MHRTRASALMMAAGMDHEVEVPGRVEVTTDARADLARTTVICGLRPGQKLRIVKYLAYSWSSQRSRPALRDQVAAAMHSARYSGWEGLLKAQREYLDDFWENADVEVEGDSESQQAVRFGLFHLVQASARAERRAIPSKGLTGTGYDGHAFWDTEGYVLPVLTYTLPHAVADSLRWRASTLDLARDRAAELGLKGASFPWRTIRGQECSAYWPAGTAAFHINADIAMAFERYRVVTGDHTLEAGMRRRGAGRDRPAVDVARAPRPARRLAHRRNHRTRRVHGDRPRQRVHQSDGRTQSASPPPRHATATPRRPHVMGVTSEEAATWRDAADAVNIPYDEELGVHQQCEGFTKFAEWDFENDNKYPLLLHEAYVRLYPAQVIKQADLVLAMQWQSHAFTPEQKARNVDYYERRMVRDSSLSACTQAVMCADVGHLELAHDYAYEAALIDLRDLHSNTRDGLHMASLAGAWTAIVGGFGGLRDDEGILTLDPQLPDGISRLRFRLRWRDFRVDRRRQPHRRHLHRARRARWRADHPARRGGRQAEHRRADHDRGAPTRKPLLPPPPQPPGPRADAPAGLSHAKTHR